MKQAASRRSQFSPCLRAVRRTLAVFTLLNGLTFLGYAHPDSTSIEMFPKDRAFPRLSADGLAHGISITRMTDTREWIGGIGGSAPLVEVSRGLGTLQVGAGVTNFSRIIKTPGHITVYTLDYKVDFPFDLRYQAISLRIAPGHVSSHFVDDGIEILGARSISYVRDYVTFMGAYAFDGPAGFAYAGGDLNYHSEPVVDKKWFLQFGWEGGNIPVGAFVELYAAVDIKIRQYVAWGTTRSFQVGARMFAKDNYRLRLAYTHRGGFEERGQLYDQSVETNLISLFLDF